MFVIQINNQSPRFALNVWNIQTVEIVGNDLKITMISDTIATIAGGGSSFDSVVENIGKTMALRGR